VTADARFLLVLLCFLLSGATALVYQTAWTREFAFVFGTSDLAVATVLAAYMGGLAIGAAAAARFASRVRRAVLVYGFLELGIGVWAFLVPAALRLATPLYVALFGGGDGFEVGGLTTALFYVVSSFAILMVPTAFMGATLPLLARHAVHSESSSARGSVRSTRPTRRAR
jgi:spermidine synthase